MRKDLIRLWLFTLFFKIVIAGFLPLFNDEAYYWVWSKHLQLSYYDHPPFISWLYWLGQPLDKYFNFVRLPSVILGHLTFWFWLEIAYKFLDGKLLKWFFWLSLFMPFVGPASLIATPDLPMLFFWSISLLLLLNILEGKNSSIYFVLLGLSIGFGFSSKYLMVLVAPIFFYSVFAKGIKNFFVNTKNFLYLLSFFSLGSLPVFWWNFQNNFQSFRFQIDHGVGAKTWNPEWTLTYTLGQIALLSPFVIYFALRNNNKSFQTIVIKWAAWVPLIFFFLTSFKGRVEANWPIMAHPSFLLLALQCHQFDAKWFRVLTTFWVCLFSAIYLNFFCDYLPIEKLREFKKFDPVIPSLNRFTPIYARTFQMASQLSFKTKQNIYKLKGMNRFDFFDSLSEFQPDGSVFYIIIEKGDQLPSEWMLKGYNVVDAHQINDKYEIWKVER